MKRAITYDELEEKRHEAKKHAKPGPGGGKGFEEMAKKAFNPNFKTLQDIKDLLKHDENSWGTYTNVVSPDKKRQQDEKTQFECYCCGWLEYYDEIVRKGCIDHTIWFDWEGPSCTIYLFPRPRKRKDAKSGLPDFRTGGTDPTNPTAPPPPY